jgi:hypothetical protein
MVGNSSVVEHLLASQERPYLQTKVDAGRSCPLNFTMLHCKEDISIA